MANATKIGLQQKRRPIAVPCQEKLSTTKAITCVISHPGNVRGDIMPTVSVMVTGQKSTLLTRVKTLADTTLMADAITTRAIVQITIIRLTVNVIGNPVCLPCQRV